MKLVTPPAYSTLDFVISHLMLHTVNKLAQISGVPGSNIRAGLQGKRPFPAAQAAKLAAATGLNLVIVDGQVSGLAIEAGAVVNLTVEAHEIEELANEVKGLSVRPLEWKFIAAESKGGIFLSAYALIRISAYAALHGYVFLTIGSLLQAAEVAVIQKKLSGKSNLPQRLLAEDDPVWLRMRGGCHRTSDLDALYGVGEEPASGPMDWARIFMLAEKYGMGPGDIAQAMHDKHRAFLAELSE